MTVTRVLIVAALVIAQSALVRAEAPAVQQSPTERAEAARRARVYARFEGGTLTVGEIEDALVTLSTFQRQRYAQDRARLRAFATQMLEAKLLAAEARRTGLASEPSIVRTRQEAAVQQLVRKRFDQVITLASVSEADVRAYYDAHVSEYSRPEMVRASHISVATEAEARALLAELRDADVARFRQVARERSLDDETKLSGGDLRYFTRDGNAVGARDRPVEPALVAAAFSLTELGALGSEPVHVGERYSVLKLTGKREAEVTPFEQAAEGIRRRLHRERREQAVETFISELRTRANVVSHPERLQALRVDAPEPALGVPGHGHGHDDTEDEH